MHDLSDFDPDDSSVRYHPEIWFVPLVDRKRRPKETLCFRSKKEAGQYPSLPFAFRATARVWRSDPIGTVHGGNNLVPIRAVQKLRESGWRPAAHAIISFVADSFNAGWSRTIRSMSHWSRVR